MADTLVFVYQDSPAPIVINVNHLDIFNHSVIHSMVFINFNFAVEFGLTKYFSPEFNGKNSYLSIPLTEDLRRSTRIEIWFGTSSANTGLLLYSGQSNTGQGDFISVYLSNGHVKLTYDLGNGKTNIT